MSRKKNKKNNKKSSPLKKKSSLLKSAAMVLPMVLSVGLTQASNPNDINNPNGIGNPNDISIRMGDQGRNVKFKAFKDSVFKSVKPIKKIKMDIGDVYKSMHGLIDNLESYGFGRDSSDLVQGSKIIIDEYGRMVEKIDESKSRMLIRRAIGSDSSMIDEVAVFGYGLVRVGNNFLRLYELKAVRDAAEKLQIQIDSRATKMMDKIAGVVSDTDGASIGSVLSSVAGQMLGGIAGYLLKNGGGDMARKLGEPGLVDLCNLLSYVTINNNGVNIRFGERADELTSGSHIRIDGDWVAEVLDSGGQSVNVLSIIFSNIFSNGLGGKKSVQPKNETLFKYGIVEVDGKPYKMDELKDLVHESSEHVISEIEKSAVKASENGQIEMDPAARAMLNKENEISNTYNIRVYNENLKYEQKLNKVDALKQKQEKEDYTVLGVDCGSFNITCAASIKNGTGTHVKTLDNDLGEKNTRTDIAYRNPLRTFYISKDIAPSSAYVRNNKEGDNVSIEDLLYDTRVGEKYYEQIFCKSDKDVADQWTSSTFASLSKHAHLISGIFARNGYKDATAVNISMNLPSLNMARVNMFMYALKKAMIEDGVLAKDGKIYLTPSNYASAEIYVYENQQLPEKQPTKILDLGYSGVSLTNLKVEDNKFVIGDSFVDKKISGERVDSIILKDMLDFASSESDEFHDAHLDFIVANNYNLLNNSNECKAAILKYLHDTKTDKFEKIFTLERDDLPTIKNIIETGENASKDLLDRISINDNVTKVANNAFAKFCTEAETIKDRLSANGASEVAFSADIGDDIYFAYSVNRINSALEKSGFIDDFRSFLNDHCDDVRNIAIVGGTLRIPLLAKIVQEFTGGRALIRTLNMDENAAQGALYSVTNDQTESTIYTVSDAPKIVRDRYDKADKLITEAAKNRKEFNLLRNELESICYSIARVDEKIVDKKILKEISVNEINSIKSQDQLNTLNMVAKKLHNLIVQIENDEYLNILREDIKNQANNDMLNNDTWIKNQANNDMLNNDTWIKNQAKTFALNNDLNEKKADEFADKATKFLSDTGAKFLSDTDEKIYNIMTRINMLEKAQTDYQNDLEIAKTTGLVAERATNI